MSLTKFPIIELGKVAKAVPGFAFKSKDWCDDGIPVIKIKNISGNLRVDADNCDHVPEELLTKKIEKYLLYSGDIVVAMTGATAGKVGKVRGAGKLLLNQRVAKVEPTEIEPDFLWAIMSTDDFQAYLYKLADGAAQPNMSGGQIEGVMIPYPDKKTQEDIGGIIAAYDKLIENNNRRIAILEEMAQSLYREWFVKFRFPGHENTKFIDSPLGKIPEGWGVKRLDDFVVLQRGFDLPKKKRNESGDIPVYAASGVNGFHDEAKVKAPGLVTGRSGTLGVVSLILDDFWPLNTALWVKEFKGCTAFYAFYLLKSIGLERFNSGASVPTLNRNDVHGYQIVSPPESIVAKFEDAAGNMLKNSNLLHRANEKLKEQRNLTLPKIISGGISIGG